MLYTMIHGIRLGLKDLSDYLLNSELDFKCSRMLFRMNAFRFIL